MSRRRTITISIAIAALVIAALVIEIIATEPVRGAIRACTELLTIANRPDLGDAERLAAARQLCSSRYLQTHELAVADGGLVGLPRNVNKNFQAWREGPNVWICPTNRVGPVYQFVFENGRWRFDGPVAILRQWGEIIRSSELPGEREP
jgi:hypothetical protein